MTPTGGFESSHSPGGQESEVGVSAGPGSLRRLRGRTLFASFGSRGCRQSLVLLGWQTHHPGLCLRLYMAVFSVRLYPNFLLLKSSRVIGLGLSSIQYDLVLNDLIRVCKNPVSKYGDIHILLNISGVHNSIHDRRWG